MFPVVKRFSGQNSAPRVERTERTVKEKDRGREALQGRVVGPSQLGFSLGGDVAPVPSIENVPQTPGA